MVLFTPLLAALTIHRLLPVGDVVHRGGNLLLLCQYDTLDKQTTDSPTESGSGGHQDLEECALAWNWSSSGSTPSVSSPLPTDVTLTRFTGDSSAHTGAEGARDDMVLSLYVKATEERHAGIYTCQLQCPGVSLSRSLKVHLDEEENSEVSADVSNEEETEEDNEDTSVILLEFRMAMAIALIFVVMGLFCLLIWVKSSIYKADLRKKQNPPTYTDVITNPDKYPMSTTRAGPSVQQASAESQVAEAEGAEAGIRDTATRDQQGQQETEEGPQRAAPDMSIFTVECHSG